MPNKEIITQDTAAIDPAKVVWDDTVQEEVIDPNQVVWDREYSTYNMTKKDRRKVYDALGGDPLAFIADESERQYVRGVTDKMPDRDEFRKRMALAAYITTENKGADYRFVLANLDPILEKFYKKKITVDQAYSDLGKLYALQESSMIKELGKELLYEYGGAFLSGGIDFVASLSAAYLRFASWGSDLQAMILSPLMSEEQKKMASSMGGFLKRSGAANLKAAEDMQKGLAPYVNMNQDFLWNTLNGDLDKVSTKDFTKALIQSVPSMGFQILLAAAAPWAAPAFLGAETVALKDYEVDEKQPDWNAGKKWSYIGIAAANEALFEYVTGKIVGKNISKEAAAKLIQQGLLKYLGKSIAKEGASEGAQQLLSNINDILFDIEGDRGKLDSQQLLSRTFKGVFESAFVGGVWGMPEGITGYRSARQVMGQVQTVRAKYEKIRNELSQKTQLTPEEKTKLENADLILDAAMPQDVIALDHIAQTLEKANSEEEIRKSDEFARAMDNAAEGTTEEMVIKAIRAERKVNMNKSAVWSPEDVVDTVQHYSNLFRDTVFNVVDSWEELPEFNIPKDHPGGAFTDLASGQIYINASKVRPGKVFETMLHETVGHKGLRKLFNSRELDELLDQIYLEHFQDQEFQKVAQRYFPEDRVELTDDEGVPYMGVSLDTVDKQRLAAEEYIAHIAEQGQKPSWWKEFIQKIRMALAKLPGFSEVRMTDEQISTVLARSSRKMRQHWYNRTSRVNHGVSMQMEGNGNMVMAPGMAGARFAIIGEEGAGNLDLFYGTHNLDNLRTAKEMLSAGKDAKTIKLATGWEKGGDGKWRMEIPDLEIKTDKAAAPVILDGYLDSLIDAKELFKAYPQLRSIIVKTADLDEGDGVFISDPPQIKIKSNIFDADEIEKLKQAIEHTYNWTEKDWKNAKALQIDGPEEVRKHLQQELDAITRGQINYYKNMLIHEVQHAIQHLEGFAPGGSPSYFDRHPVQSNEAKQAIESAVKKEYDLKIQLLSEHPELVKDFHRYWELDKVYETDVQIDEAALLDEMDQIDQRFRDAGSGEIWDQYHFAIYELRNAQRKGFIPSWTAYYNTAGEVEARNAVNRTNMSAEEKRQSLLAETEDVAEESKIYLFGGNGESLMTPLRREGAPNTAEQKGNIRDGNVPCVSGFMEWAGLKGKRIAADYEYLYGHHPEYFKSQEEVQAAVELVLSKPEKVKDLNGNLSFVGFDEITGTIYRLEISPIVKNKTNFVRSIFEISAKQYQKNKLAESPVLQPAPTEDKQSAVRTLSNFMRNVSQLSDNASGEITEIDGSSMRFSIAPEEDQAYLDAVERGDMEAAQKMVNEAERKSGYSADDSWRMNHRAPNSQDVKADPDGPVQKITDWRKMMPKDFFDHPEYYINMDDPAERESLFHVRKMLEIYEQKKAEGKGKEKKVMIQMYRAVDQSANSKESHFRNGDWITPSRTYAEREGKLNSGKYRIITHAVALEDVYWDGNSISEMGFDDGKNYTYADTKNNRKLLDAVTYDDDGNVIPLSQRFNKRKEDVRYDLTDYSEEEQNDYVDILRPFVGTDADMEAEKYRNYLRDKGVEIPPEDADLFFRMAVIANRRDALKAGIRKNRELAYAYWASSNPLVQFILDFTGTDDFSIRPSHRFEGEDFSGSFIAKEFVEYSEKRSQGKKESDSSYRRYLARRQEKLKKADGHAVYEIAEQYARKMGLDALDVEQEIIDTFRNLKKKDILQDYKRYREENFARTKEEAEEAARAFADHERERIEEEVVDILTSGRQIDEEWIDSHRDVYKELYARIMGKDAPYSISQTDLAALNAAIRQETGNAATYAQAYKSAREDLRREFQAQLNSIRQQIQQKEIDTVRLQKEAAAFAARNLPKENRSEFIRRILSLAQLSVNPSPKYPEGHRQQAFDDLMAQIRTRAVETRKLKDINAIRDLLDRNRSRRTDKNVPYSPMGERQTALDRISQITRMAPETIMALKAFTIENTEALQNQLDAMETSDEPAAEEQKAKIRNDLAKAEHDIYYIDNFGNLAQMDPEKVSRSLQKLKDFIREGRKEFKTAMDQRAERIRLEREKLRTEMAKGDLTVPARNALDLTRNWSRSFLYNALSDTQMLRDFSRISDDVDFDESQHGKVLAMIEKSTLIEDTFKRQSQEKIDDFFRNNGLKDLIARGKFLRKLREKSSTGIRIREYGRKSIVENQNKQAAKEDLQTFDNFSRGRPVRSAFVVLEHARRIMEDLNSGTKIKGIILLKNLDNASTVYSQIRSMLADRNLSRRSFTCALTGNNKIRIYATANDNQVISHDVDMDTLPAVQAIASEPDAIFPMDEFAIASGTARITEFDAGAKLFQENTDYGDDLDAAAMQAYFDSDVKEPVQKVRLDGEDPNAIWKEKELELSPEAAVQIILTSEQENYATNMAFNGFTPETLSALKKWVQKTLPGALEFGYALREIVSGQREQLDQAVFRRFGVHLPETKNFWYADFGTGVKDQVRDPGFGNPAGGMTVSSNFLTARRYHTLPVNIQSGFLSLFLRKQPETAHFIAWSDTVRDLRSLYGDIAVQNILIREFGADAWDVWKKRIELFASGGDPGNVMDRIANYFNETFFPANIALNLKSMVSQVAGGLAYALYVPPAELLKRMKFDRNSPEYRAFLKMVEESGYLANRSGGGLDPTLRRMTDLFRKKEVSPLADSLMEKSLAMTTKGDKVAALSFGYAAYDYFLHQALKKGSDRKKAVQYAIHMWMRATDETQQSGAMKDRNTFNINAGVGRAITAYMTSPMQQLGLELSSISRYMKDRSPQARNEMLRRIFVNHILVTTSMNLISSAFRHGINFGDYLDDWEDYVFGWLFGNLDAVWFFGKLARAVITGDYYGVQPTSLIPSAHNVVRDFNKIRKDIEGKSKVNPLDYLQAAGDLMMSAGPPITRVLGAGMYVGTREIKRFGRMFDTGKDD